MTKPIISTHNVKQEVDKANQFIYKGLNITALNRDYFERRRLYERFRYEHDDTLKNIFDKFNLEQHDIEFKDWSFFAFGQTSLEALHSL